jgi:hypothetical protein
MGLFLSAHRKLARARELIDELEKLLATHLQENLVSSELLGPMESDDGGPTWISAKVSLPLAPDRSAILVGDIVHNMRTSLDHMASEMARLNGKGDASVNFPFSNSAAELKKMIEWKKFYFCGGEAVALLRTFEPYRGGNLELRAIHDLDNGDKHRALIPRAELQGDIKPFDITPTHVENGKMRGTVKWIAPEVSNLQYVFSGETDLKDRPLVETLKELVGVCEGVVKAFAALEFTNEARADPGDHITPQSETHQILYVRTRIEKAEERKVRLNRTG